MRAVVIQWASCAQGRDASASAGREAGEGIGREGRRQKRNRERRGGGRHRRGKRRLTSSMHHPSNTALKYSSSPSTRPCRIPTESTTDSPRFSFPPGTLYLRFYIAPTPTQVSFSHAYAQREGRGGEGVRGGTSRRVLGMPSWRSTARSSPRSTANTSSNLWCFWTFASAMVVCRLWRWWERRGEAMEG